MKNVIIVMLAVLVLALGGYLIYDKVFTKEDLDQKNIKNEDDNEKYDNLDNEEIAIHELFGTYTWEKNYINDFGNQLILKIKLVLNSDGTATYEASSGYDHEANRGSYIYEDEKIIYTKEYHNYNGTNGQTYDSVYTDSNSKTETFIIIDKNTLQAVYHDHQALLKK